MEKKKNDESVPLMADIFNSDAQIMECDNCYLCTVGEKYTGSI